MAQPIASKEASSRWAVLVLVFMVRVLGRINGLLEPFVTLRVDTTADDPIAARRALVC